MQKKEKKYKFSPDLCSSLSSLPFSLWCFRSGRWSREIIFNANRQPNGRLRNSPCTSNPLYRGEETPRYNRVQPGTPTRKRGARPRGKLSRQEASVFTLRPLVERRHTRRKHHALFVSRISRSNPPPFPPPPFFRLSIISRVILSVYRSLIHLRELASISNLPANPPNDKTPRSR